MRLRLLAILLADLLKTRNQGLHYATSFAVSDRQYLSMLPICYTTQPLNPLNLGSVQAIEHFSAIVVTLPPPQWLVKSRFAANRSCCGLASKTVTFLNFILEKAALCLR